MKVRLREWHWVPFFYALVVIWIYRDLWHVHGQATGLGWDTIDTHGPDLDFFARDLREGRFSLWNPYDKGGYPVFCDPVFDRYYPVNWPFAAFGAIAGTGWWLVQIKVLVHHVIAGSMMHAFLRSRRVSIRGALLGGVGLIASTPLLHHKASNILWPLVWVPLVWIAIDYALAKPSWRRGVLVGGALLLPMTAGSPPGLFYAGLLIAPYAVLRFVQCVRAKPDYKALAWTIGCALGIALLVAGVTIIPTQQLVALGSRDKLGYGDPSFALTGSMYLPRAAIGVFVRGAGPFEIYCGATLALLGVLAVVQRPNAERILLVGLVAFGVILAAGSSALVLNALVKVVPGFALLRVPGRYKLLTAWALAALAGMGVDTLGEHRRRGWIVCGVMLVITVIAVLVEGYPATTKDRPAWLSIIAIAIPILWFAVDHRHALSLLILTVLIDAPIFTFVEPNAPVAAEARQLHEADDEILGKLDGVHDRYRIYDEFVLGERVGARQRVRDFRGYPAVDPISLHRYSDVLDYASVDARILADYNVRYVLSKSHFRYGTGVQFVHVSSAHSNFKKLEPRIFEVMNPAPLVAWVGAIEIVHAPGDVLPAVRAIEHDGIRDRAIIEPEDATRLSPAAFVGQPGTAEGTVSSYEPDRIVTAIDAPRAGLVVLNEIDFPGWHLTIDGDPAPIVRANFLLRAAWVPAGHHELVWKFDPPHWRIFVGGYVLALVVLGIALASRARRDT
ncbi:MAG: hypothetical protein QM831_25380 [Kofleriaceae bacterium]